MSFGDPTWNQPKTPSNPRLLRALSNLTGDDVSRRQFYDALLNSTLFVPTELNSFQTPIQPLPPHKQTFLLIEDEQGHNTLPAFTDLQALRRFTNQPDSQAYVTMPLQELLTNLPTEAAGLWLNLADRASRVVSRGELSQITGGLVTTSVAEAMRREVAPPGAKLNFRIPANIPTGLVDRARAALNQEPEVAVGYLVLITQKGKRGRLAVGIRLTRVVDDATVDKILFRVRRYVNQPLRKTEGVRPKRVAVHCVLLDQATYEAISKALPPIYEQLGDGLDLKW
jgi:SseB protein N-terminal domain/SseB protein C-terminal domain